MQIEDRLNHIGELVKGLSEQTSGNMTILNSNCQMLGNRLEDLEKKVQELETKTASDLSQKENSGKPNNHFFDRERALELVQDIENCSTKNSNASTKAILLSCEELRQLLGNE